MVEQVRYPVHQALSHGVQRPGDKGKGKMRGEGEKVGGCGREGPIGLGTQPSSIFDLEFCAETNWIMVTALLQNLLRMLLKKLSSRHFD